MTVATLQRLWSIGVPLLGAAIAWWWLPAPADPWVVVAAAVGAPVAVIGVLLAIEFTLAAMLDPRSPRTSALRVARVWLQEARVSLRIFLWRQPWRAGFPEPTLVHEPQRPALLLIPGFLCNRAAWRGLLDSGLLREFNVATVNLEPIYGDIDTYADVVGHAVEALRAATGAARVVLVGHSMGGLAARAYLRKHGDAQVAHVVTLASPHHGTVLGRLGGSRNARQMAHGSRFLHQLASTDRGRCAKFTCVATRDDNLLVPRSSPLLPGAKTIELDGVGHLALIEDPRAWRIIADAVRAHAAAPRLGPALIASGR